MIDATVTADCLEFGKFFLARSNARDLHCWIKTMHLEYNLLAGTREVLAWLSDNNYFVRDAIISRLDDRAIINPYFHDLFIVSTILHDDDEEREYVIITPKGFMTLTPKIVEHFYNKKMNELNADEFPQFVGRGIRNTDVSTKASSESQDAL